MKFYLENQHQDLMRSSFFQFRKKMQNSEDAIVTLIEDEHSTAEDIIQAQKKLLELEGEFRTKFNKWNSPPVRLETLFLPRFSL